MSDAIMPPVDERFYSPEKRRRFHLVGLTLLLSVIALHFLLTSRIQKSLAEHQDGVWFEYADAKAAVQWRGDIWFPAVAVSNPNQMFTSETRRHLVHMKDRRPAEVCSLGAGQSWLMPREDELWIFSSDGVSFFNGETIQRIQAATPPDSDGPPILWDEKPTFITRAGNAVSIKTLEDKEWRELASFSLQGDITTIVPELRLSAIGDALAIFYRHGKDIFAQVGLPAGPVDPLTWRKVTQTSGPWAAAAIDGKLHLLTFQTKGSPTEGAVVLHRYDNDNWSESTLQEIQFPLSSIGAFSNDKVHVLYQSVPWMLTLLTIDNGVITEGDQFGRFFEISDPEIYLILIGEAFSALLAILLVVSFWGMMITSRPPIYTLMGPPVMFASIPRRALALLLDAILLFAPFVTGLIFLWRAFSNIESPGIAAVVAVPLVFGGLLWAAIGVLVLSFAQGRYGRTFGKWLLGIRVVTLELRPAGFWRSLLRTFFLIPDAWLSFTVAIALVAYSRHWQRLGDLFTRTIVIRDIPQPTNLAHIQSEQVKS